MDFCSVKDQPGKKIGPGVVVFFWFFFFSKSLLQFRYHKNCHIFLIIILKFYILILLRLKENFKNLTILFRTEFINGLPDITGRTALAVWPDVLNANHVITNATYSSVTIATLYRRSANMSRILKLVRYYAVIISPCGKLWMQTWWKMVPAVLTKTSKF